MKRFGLVTLLGLFLIVAACEESEVSPTSQKLVGTWQLYEYGWSPGSGYFVDEVPPAPAQTLTFSNDGRAETQGDKTYFFKDLKRYRAVRDSTQGVDHVEFLSSNSDTWLTVHVTLLTPDSLTLRPMCFEGCHYGFVRVSQPTLPKDDF